MSMEKRYSLWLMPPEAVRARFARLIADLSARFDTPRFEPHLTLASGYFVSTRDALTAVAGLAARCPPVFVHLTHAGTADAYFRCLFVHAELTPALRALQQAAAAALGQSPEADFMPHLSLVYGHLTATQKEQILREIGRRFDIDFVADRLALYAPEGEPERWRSLGEFVLSGSP